MMERKHTKFDAIAFLSPDGRDASMVKFLLGSLLLCTILIYSYFGSRESPDGCYKFGYGFIVIENRIVTVGNLRTGLVDRISVDKIRRTKGHILYLSRPIDFGIIDSQIKLKYQDQGDAISINYSNDNGHYIPIYTDQSDIRMYKFDDEECRQAGDKLYETARTVEYWTKLR